MRQTAATDCRLNLSRHQDDGIAVLRPATITAAIIFASIPTMSSHAANAFDMTGITYSSSEMWAIHHPKSRRGGGIVSSSPSDHRSTTAISSSLQLSSSTVAKPIGESKDGSETGIEYSFGQWFFLIYVGVSLLAGGKEMVSRIQKQMDKDN